MGVRNSNYPVNSVEFEAARAYCHFIGGRLPTAAEWIWAYTNAGTTHWPYGDVAPEQPRACCATASSADRPCPVGTSEDDVSAQGIRDLVGNLWELVEDEATPPPGGGFMVSVCPRPPRPGYVTWTDPVGGMMRHTMRCAADPDPTAAHAS
jgi:formylglycine-generating enzyme required for sulfatase activity